ncbi:hypothetical protein F441_00632 [Phytophthora nicotianae CJ01A1]|uniref:Uncharacterized protein n=2 Tax=Phytophthora nicotianae TaxID=4792 RepID=W2RFB3_PHYN3|nr:hypothetical protein PPTG_00531 [Phytophthora nicotianae INRA-310]XP_008890176.1 hypothetical protein PPTG_00532 [Phytophthora nicotianae INRA-310]ETN24076.1 hypothetical protein PPTG_00531 [Phytophthora nicotianae INRA-310]ETN24077.1 hypothetical protein PPTG_00532 [Phytophthora nicotianae INRA-310]ETP26765.1 hypothetical protein F441_00632 [Phytophthora nicotianae CJ01A1]
MTISTSFSRSLYLTLQLFPFYASSCHGCQRQTVFFHPHGQAWALHCVRDRHWSQVRSESDAKFQPKRWRRVIEGDIVAERGIGEAVCCFTSYDGYGEAGDFPSLILSR